ncbi:MAG: hypothetical protein MJ188_08815 [Treponema sp.]|nr:hypothetical protein [Treponema sp.]
MQELRSTEILDKEIQAEARRKVEDILKRAEEEGQKVLSEVDEKIAAAKKEKEDFYSKKLNALKMDLDASIPLEKQRFEVTFIQSAIIALINEYLKNMSEEQRIELVTKQLNENCDFNMPMNAYIYGFNVDAAKKMLSQKLAEKLGKCEETVFGKIVAEKDIGLTKNEGIILESEDRTLRYRLTLVEVFSRILDKNRAELSDALFGQGR